MAALRRLTVKVSGGITKFPPCNRCFGTLDRLKSLKGFEKMCIGLAGGSVLLFAATQIKSMSTVHAFKPKKTRSLTICLDYLPSQRHLGHDGEADDRSVAGVFDFQTDGRTVRGTTTLNAVDESSLGRTFTFVNRKFDLLQRDDEYVGAVKLTTRERRFIKFASVEYDGQLYMTPQDFLESVVEQEPRPRLKRRFLTEKEVEKIKDYTPSLKKGSSEMFRKLRDKGIISYTEYLFLLSILTKPQSGFRIAFNMFDTDGNERVDKTEFLVLVEIIAKHTTKEMKTRKCDEKSQTAMEKIFSHAWKDRRGINAKKSIGDDAGKGKGVIQDEYVDDEQGLQRRHNVDTTLITHFFGKKGNDELRFEGFKRFMENLQSEVLELEFHEFSKGHNTISEVDFARILLRYTYLDTDEYDRFLNRLLDRVKEEKGITLQEFKGFCQFLNNLEDFAIAMKMYTLADHPISKDEFHRAVKICTGNALSRHLVHTVFAIFDEDGDGHLSYREFIAIMKERLHRGFKVIPRQVGYEAWKNCIREMSQRF